MFIIKAIVVESFGGPEVLKIKDISIPDVKDNEVLIKTFKTSVNFADIKKRKGNKGEGQFPFIPGIDAVGEVVDTGSQVQDVNIGDRVIAFPLNGSYAEYIVASSDLTFVIPDKLDLKTAAASPIVSFLSYILLKHIGRIKKGENVLIHAAAGGVGTTAIQFAKTFGANKVIGTVSHASKKETVLKAGADYCLLYDEFDREVNKLTNDVGVDVILDSVAGKVSEQSMNCLADYGRLVHFGNSSGEVGNFITKDLHSSCRSILGFSFGTTRKKKPEILKEVAKEVFKLLEDNRVSIFVSDEFDLKDAHIAHKIIESRKSTGKILLNIS